MAGAAWCATGCSSSNPSEVTEADSGASRSDPLPWDQRLALERTLAESDPAHAPRNEAGGIVLHGDGVSATLDSRGARLRLDRHEVAMAAVAIGREGGPRRALGASAPEIAGPEVRTDRGDGVVEWWRSLPSGLEHGVTLAKRPGGGGRLFVELEVRGELSARTVSDDAIDLVDASGRAAGRYAHLAVLDARGGRVPARMEARDGRIVLAVDDAHARYPLVIDPLLVAEEATLVAPDGARNDQFGFSVSLSSDGARALVGAHLDDTAGGSGAGSAHIFLRVGTAWTHEAMLIASDGAASDGLGRAVSLSSDGSVALVGAFGDSTAGGDIAGSARVFVRTATAWSEEATLLAPDGAPLDRFGSSVSLSSDGSRALVGAYVDDTAGGIDAGSAHVFVRTGSAWSAEAMLVASDGAAGDWLGYSVALSSDGTRALVGARLDDTPSGVTAGSARVFLRTGTTWAEEATLVASDGAAYDELGWSVSLSSDGSRALVGAPFDDTAGGLNAGSARAFLRTGTAWAEEATLLAPDGAPDDWLGHAVSLSSDGSRALVSAYGDDAARFDSGSARLFQLTGPTWTHEATLLASDAASTDFIGYSISLSADGTRALLGGHRDDTSGGLDAGSARVFTIRPDDSTACSDASACPSGFCVDGVCCDSACGAGATDCQACSAALTGRPDGTCAPLAASIAATVTCRGAVGVCDAPEVCTAESMLCPADAFVTATTVCRPAVGGCDPAPEMCSGANAECPPDAPASAGTICRPVAGACDVAEVCDGTSYDCPAADAHAGTDVVCRPPAGPCDAADNCDGSSVACPADALLSAAVVCRDAAGSCDVEDRCSGTSADCPPDALSPAGTECAPASGEACDAPDVCTGTSADCMPRFLSGVECRAASGGCDLAEICAGSSASCPPDAIAPTGTECRASSDTSCDPAESCDGASTACPADTTMCGAQDAGSLDGGGGRPDAGPPPVEDAGSLDGGGDRSDAGPAHVVVAEGCGCRAGSRSPTPIEALALLPAVAILIIRRRSARRR